ncbi:MAG: globin [Alteromonadaceae bacterium]|nr:globin [Alteromonadaceae bacterium]
MTPADRVFQSYGRCCRNEQFFIDFYTHFLGSSEQIRNRFAQTDMAAQRHLLRSGVMHLILYARGMSDRKLVALGESHNRHHYNIDPAWYDLWLSALLKTVKLHDPQCSRQLEQDWRDVLLPGIELIRGSY